MGTRNPEGTGGRAHTVPLVAVGSDHPASQVAVGVLERLRLVLPAVVTGIVEVADLDVPGHHVGYRRLIGGLPPSALWRRTVL